MEVKIKVLEGVETPSYQTEGAAGFDFKAHSFKKVFSGKKEIDLTKELVNSISQGYITLRPGERVMIGTGIFVELPVGKQLEVRSRSGMVLNRGLVVANQPGTVDADYRGEICIILVNTNQFLAKVELGERIAQGVITDYYQAEFVKVEELSDTNRGAGGFGSTGSH